MDGTTVWTLVACPFHALTGLYCPLCGSTRAIWALLHGDLLLAARCNLLLVGAVMWTAPVVVGALAAAGLGGAKAPPYNPRDVVGRRHNRRSLVGRGFSRGDDGGLVGRGFGPGAWRSWAALTVLAIFTVARNLPGVWWLQP